MTHCNKQRTLFQPHFSRRVKVDFSAEPISSDGGGLLLRELEQRLGMISSFANCFRDYPEATKSNPGNRMVRNAGLYAI